MNNESRGAYAYLRCRSSRVYTYLSADSRPDTYPVLKVTFPVHPSCFSLLCSVPRSKITILDFYRMQMIRKSLMASATVYPLNLASFRQI